MRIIIEMNSNSSKIKRSLPRLRNTPLSYVYISTLLTLSAFLATLDPVASLNTIAVNSTTTNNKFNSSQQQRYQSTSLASVNNNKSTNSGSHTQHDNERDDGYEASGQKSYAIYDNNNNNNKNDTNQGDAIGATRPRPRRQATFDSDSNQWPSSSTESVAGDANEGDNLDEAPDEAISDQDQPDFASQQTPPSELSQVNSQSTSHRPTESVHQLPRSTFAVLVPPLIEKPTLDSGSNNNKSTATLHRRTAPQLYPSDDETRSSRAKNNNNKNNLLLQPIPTMNVDMGAERILIKSANAERSWPATNPPEAAAAATASTTSLSMHNSNNNEQFNRDLQLDDGAPSERHHHLDLLYPSSSALPNPLASSDDAKASPQHSMMHELTLHQQQQQSRNNNKMEVMMLPTSDLNARTDSLNGVGGADTQANYNRNNNAAGPQICYTPITLMLVILITMTATLVVAILTHYTMKQLGRRQFDLIESTKQFDTEHQRGHSNQNRFQGPSQSGADATNGKPMFMLGAANPMRSRGIRNSSSLDNNNQDDDDDYIDHLGPFGTENHSSVRKQKGNQNNCRDLRQTRCLTANELEHFAFDNPYFRGCDDGPTQMVIGDDNHQHHQATATTIANNSHSTTTTATNFTADSSLTSQQQQRRLPQNSAGLLAVVGSPLSIPNSHSSSTITTATCNNMSNHNININESSLGKAGPVNDAPALQSFIEHHISNLHSRQVTSSVKELTISGHSPELKLSIRPKFELREPTIVDLRYDQRSMVNAKEGELVAVDLSGQDFIGLGFGICGNVREGIFISSILGSGPARDSGLIHRGDRIKCLNISFDGVTLEDAREILNCGAPYKLRLLLEKGKECARNNHSNKSSLTNHSTNSGDCGATKRIKSKTKNFLTDNQSGGFNATKSYIKDKLSNLVSPSSLVSRGNASDQFTATPTHKSVASLNSDVRTSPNLNDSNNNNNFTISYSEPEIYLASNDASNCAHDVQQPGQGSLASKRHLSSGEKTLNLTSVGRTTSSNDDENSVTN